MMMIVGQSSELAKGRAGLVHPIGARAAVAGMSARATLTSSRDYTKARDRLVMAARQMGQRWRRSLQARQMMWPQLRKVSRGLLRHTTHCPASAASLRAAATRFSTIAPLSIGSATSITCTAAGGQSVAASAARSAARSAAGTDQEASAASRVEWWQRSRHP
jgi:hypothetical protein